MVRQCAWCLRLIDEVGERTSAFPLPKIYEATHGICKVCGISWLEAVGGLGDDREIVMITYCEDGRYQIQCESEAKFPAIAPASLPEIETQRRAEATIPVSDGNTSDIIVLTHNDELCPIELCLI